MAGQDQPETSTGFLCCWCQSWWCPNEGGAAAALEWSRKGRRVWQKQGSGICMWKVRGIACCWWQGIKEPLQNSCCAVPGSASESVKYLLLVWGSCLSSVDVLTYSRAEPVDDHQQQKTSQGPQVLTFHFGCQSPPSQPTFSEGNYRFPGSLTVSVSSVLSVCGYLVG